MRRHDRRAVSATPCTKTGASVPARRDVMVPTTLRCTLARAHENDVNGKTQMSADAHIEPACDRIGYRYRTKGRTVTEADIVFHAGQTGDLFPIHLDAEAAAQTRYGQRVAHGTLVLSIAMGLKYTTDPTMGFRISYGYDRVRFRAPVFIGDTIGVDVEVTQSAIDTRNAARRRIVESMQVTNQRGETVLSVDHILVRWL